MVITRQIIFLAKKDCIEELKALLKSTIEESKKEEGCLMYEVFQTKSNPVEFIVIDSSDLTTLIKTKNTKLF